ncbi:unnamed protein product [Adineta ricciae]|uniref:Bromo domain-containing protein n=1 Tax=Adineta ricciae TaxID=249248 RepID=A0A813XRA6_ADIRI|nr:unnamed protein product [Adineta ricciae]CAF1458373.1 unnamed protein product [Adineta ricciae]
MFRRGTKRPRFSLGGHPIIDHDDSSNHSGLGMPEYEEDSLSQQHQATTASNLDSSFSYGHFAPDRPRRAPKSITKSHQDDNTNLNACLDHLLRTLSRKDKEGFFQYPVTDQFAPGYSTIIARPMDFSTMKRKISQDDYYNIIEFRADFELMCENAMKYNRPDTIYWQAAKKLLATGSKLMNKDKILGFRRSLECFSRLTERELGFRIDSSNHSTDEQISNSTEQLDSSTADTDNLSSMSVSQACSQRKPKLILKLPKFCETIPAVIPDEEEEEEEYSPEEILLQAKQAAMCAREKLNLRPTICLYALAYQRANAKTSLLYVNQDDYSQQIVALGETNALSTNENASISSALPVVNGNEQQTYLASKHYLENGPFSSNASQCDSTFSSMPKEELDLLIHTYGSEFSAQYAVSLMDYVKDAGDLALAYVDRFLSVLTNGEHDNFTMKKRDKQPKVEENDNPVSQTTPADSILSSDSTLDTSTQIKQEAIMNVDGNLQQQQLNSTFDDDFKYQMQFRQTQYEHLSQSQQHQSTNDYDLAEKALFDLPQISNGTDQGLSSESIHHSLDMMHSNDSTFDTLFYFLCNRIMSKSGQTLRIPPIRPIPEFVGGNDWVIPTFNPKDFGVLQKQIISNLIYYQSNYGAVAVTFLLLVAFFRPTALIFGLIVVAGLIAGYVYATRQKIALPPFLHDRPIFILALVLVTAFVVTRMFGTMFVFLFGIAFPLAAIVAHAIARKPTLQNKAENTVENLSLQSTPMGLLLTWLGAQAAAAEESTPTTKRK